MSHEIQQNVPFATAQFKKKDALFLFSDLASFKVLAFKVIGTHPVLVMTSTTSWKIVK